MRPELSIIIPVLDEAHRISELLYMLAGQQRADFEVVLADGGSADKTVALVQSIRESLPYEIVLINTDRGRGRQMNAGALYANGNWLLFLHADSIFSDPEAVYKGLQAVKDSGRTAAGRFALRFDCRGSNSSFGHLFREGKAQLGRHGCIMGDQGLLLTRDLFERAGFFNESLPVAEDVLLAEQIRLIGRPVLLSADIITSSRRFETEGYLSRQILNAVIMALLFTGYTDILATMTGVYACQSECRRLELGPFFDHIASKIAALSLKNRYIFWYQIGAYVRSNAWQVFYALDIVQIRKLTAGGNTYLFLGMYDRIFDRLTDHAAGKFLTGAVVWLWFVLAMRWRWLRGERAEK